MLRRAFLRRMAAGAMAGMLGLDLARHLPHLAPSDPQPMVAYLDSTDRWYPTLGDALDDARPGGTITLRGRITESLLVKTRGLTFRGGEFQENARMKWGLG